MINVGHNPPQHLWPGALPANFETTATGATTIVPGVSGRRIEVLAAEMSSTGKAEAAFRSSGTDLWSRVLKFGFGSRLNGSRRRPVFRCSVGDDLQVNVSSLASGAAVSGSVVYRMSP